MNTAARAANLARAASHFPLLGECTPEDLLELVEKELGHREILDGFRPYGRHFSKAEARGPLLHIVSGNTPHAALQSVIRGLLLGGENFVKLPSNGMEVMMEFLHLIDDRLRSKVEIRTKMHDEWLEHAAAYIVFGSDETIAHFRELCGPERVFEEHGHRWSIGAVFQTEGEAACRAARDVSLYNQKGCLSPHDIYVAGDAFAFAEKLAVSMREYAKGNPPEPITAEEAAEIYELRNRLRFRSATQAGVRLWESEGSLDWTVIWEQEPEFRPSCLNRVVYVKPLSREGLAVAMGAAAKSIGAVGVWPATPEAAEQAAVLRPSRICPLGQMQYPGWTWHQEGRQVLAPLVRWVDFEPDIR